MKAITIYQPWATLIALGEKQFETRSWETKYRGQLAIHAAKKVDREAYLSEPFWSILREHGIVCIDDLPTGAIVATCNLTDCLGIGTVFGNDRVAAGDNGPYFIPVTSNEYHFGYFESGRYAWKLENVQRISKPIQAKGQQGFWNWDGGSTE
jgi:activating signal cointegrator 1